MRRALSAPGKLFIAGEYAVLWGGAARVLAAGPRSHALIQRREDREVEVLLAEGRLTGTLTPAGVRWHREVQPGFRFAARAIDGVVAIHGQETLGFTLALSPSQEALPGRKLGMGGSARAVVLATEAVRYVLETKLDTLKMALWAHASAQGMRGSGGDVAASFAGGVIRYRRYPVEKLSPQGHVTASALSIAPPVDLRRLSFPSLYLSYAFTGQSASTESLIDKAEERLDEDARIRFAGHSDALGEALDAALQKNQFTSVSEVVSELHTLLCSLGALETDGIRQIIALSRGMGSAAKISGAGGGDGCIIFSPDADVRGALLQSFEARGIFALPLIAEPGLQGEAEAPPQLVSWFER